LKYQRCTRCVQNDEIGSLITNENGQQECNWENGRYEITFVQGQTRVDCIQNSNDCGTNLCRCDEELAWELAENQHLFNRKMSTQQGFEFEEQCLPRTSPGPGNDRGQLQCCGSYPNRVPYHDQNGGRQCCIDRVYNSAEKQCCGDGTVTNIDGTC